VCVCGLTRARAYACTKTGVKISWPGCRHELKRYENVVTWCHRRKRNFIYRIVYNDDKSIGTVNISSGFCFVFAADEPDDAYAHTDLCFRDDPNIDVCIRERINDVIERFHKGTHGNNTRVCIHMYCTRGNVYR